MSETEQQSDASFAPPFEGDSLSKESPNHQDVSEITCLKENGLNEETTEKVNGACGEDEEHSNTTGHSEREVPSSTAKSTEQTITQDSPVVDLEHTEGAGGGGAKVDPNNAKEPTKSEQETSDGWTDILGSGSLMKKVMRKGKGQHTCPFSGCVVTAKVEGRLEDGVVVDHDNELKFTVGDGDVIQALELSVPLMEADEIAEVYTDARFAYGEIGREPDIPKDSSVTYTIELLNIDNPVDITKLSATEKFTLGDQKRERGNYLYSRAEFSGAINSYRKALTILEDDTTNSEADPSQLQLLIDTRVKCYGNLAASQLKIEAYDAAIKSCDCVLNIHPQNIKALFRKGKSLAAKGEVSGAITLLRKALGFEPESKILHVELAKLVNRMKKEEQKTRAMYRKMLGTDNIDGPIYKPNDQTRFTKWGIFLGASVALLLSVGVAAYKYRLWP